MEIIGDERILIDILTYPTTIKTFLSLRRVSRRFKELADNNIQTLVSDKNVKKKREFQVLNPNILLKMKKIKEIGEGIIIPTEYYLYPSIRLDYKNFMTRLACHETLSSATFTMVDVKRGIKAFMDHFRSKDRSYYNFTFMDKENNNSYLRLDKIRLTLRQMMIDPDKDFYTVFWFDYHVRELYFDNCHHSMFESFKYHDKRKYYFDRIILDYVDSPCGSRNLERILFDELTYFEAKEYHLIVSQEALESLIKLMKDFTYHLAHVGASHVTIEKFFPFPAKYSYLARIHPYFQGLKSISLFARTIKDRNMTSNLISILNRYPEIILVRSSSDNHDYLQYFPDDLVAKIKFTTLDQRFY